MKKFLFCIFISSSAMAGTHIMFSDILPGGATSYIQNSSTLQSGATAYPDFLYVGSSATIGLGGLAMVAGSSVASVSTEPLYLAYPNVAGASPILKLTGSSDLTGLSGITFSDRDINFKRIIAGPSASFSLSANTAGMITHNSDSLLCSDLSSTCLSGQLYLEGTSGVVIDSTGKINTGGIKQKNALLAIGGSALIGIGYSDFGAMPVNGLRVMGEMITSSLTVTGLGINSTAFNTTSTSATVTGIGGLNVSYGISVSTITTTGIITLGAPATLKGYTVATLPTGIQGHVAMATDLLAPTFMAAAVGGGAVVGVVFYNGSSWVSF